MIGTADAGALADRRILITGGSGFIGRHMVSAMAGAGAHVRVVDLQPPPADTPWGPTGGGHVATTGTSGDPDVEIVIGDIAEADVIEEAFDGGFDGVIHLAAVTSVLKSIEQPELTYRTNVAGTHRVLEGARAAGVGALVFASTNAVTGPMEEPAITERARLRPLTPYGATKAAGEMLMSASTAVYGVRCTYLRLTNVYGPGMQAKDSIVARLMRGIRLGTTFEIYGDGLQVRDYVHAHDVVAAARLALTNETWSGPVVIGSGKSLSVLEVVDEVRRVTGAELDTRHGPAKVGEMPAVIVDNSQARAAGWSPQYDFSRGVTGVWEEWRDADIEGAIPLPGGAGMTQGAGGAV